MPVCQSCSREVAAGRFCPECGAALAQPTGAAPAPPAEAAQTVERGTVTSPDPRPPSSSSSSIHGRFDPGTRLGSRYRVVGLLGRGGMGEVYRADDLELNQSVALKFLPERVARNAADLARLRSEVRTARQIAHPNVCRTYDISEADGQVFVVMEYVDGEDLASVLRRLGRPSHDKALEIARQLCLGLGAAHENGVLHRDLKPANIMIDGRGRVRITDFGLAGTVEEAAAERAVSGTAGYMAPEQLRSGGGSIASDIYSLGLVLYEVFTGKKASDMTPRPDPSRPGSDSSVRTPSSLVADIDPAVERVILRCLEHDPARRPQSAYAVFGAFPGGDPLAAAVAAGETPSPELVANAGVEGSVRPLFAGLAVLFVVAGMLIISAVYRPLFSGFDRSKQELALRAQEILTGATGRTASRFSVDGFRYEPAAKDSAQGDASGPRHAGTRAAPQITPKAGAKQYWRRWSPEELESENIHDLGPGIGNPPQVFPGSGTVLLSPEGRLIAASIVPEPSLNASAATGPDWVPVIRATGRDPASLASTAPPHGFVADADTVAAWRVSGPALPETTLVAAALGGRIVRVDTYAGPKALGDLTAAPDPDPSTPGNWIFLVLVFIVPLIGGILLARRNVRSGRVDGRGAAIAATLTVCLYLLAYLFRVDLTELGPFRVLFAVTASAPLGHAFLHAVTLALGYVAIEPYVRRLWPQALVSWARIVAGRFRDPIVGRDVLIGACWATATVLIDALFSWLARALSLTNRPNMIEGGGLATILGPKYLLAVFSTEAAVSLYRTTVTFTILVVLRFVLRSNRAAALGLTALFATFFLLAFGERFSWLLVVYVIINAALTVVVMLRYGFVAVAFTLLFQLLYADFPWTTDFGTWFAAQTILAWVIFGVMLAYGFATAVGGRSLFRDPLAAPAPVVRAPSR